ncbi:MAG TPA: hypothetical protein VJ953_16690 [Saprospiraceae bacterium]|nr:hypothetical protein [Saprospiraceae bacterium]
MITITYPKADADLERVLEKIKDLSLAHKTVASPATAEIQLEDGITKVQGEAAIQAYLEKLEGELDQWYYCSC